MAKLCQIIAILNGKNGQKVATRNAVTEVYHTLQKSDLFKGLTRDYRPVKEDGEQLPPERKNVPTTVKAELAKARKVWTELFNLTAMQDLANCTAKADVVVENKVILHLVPATQLIFLEKQLTDIHTMFANLPELPTEKIWHYDENRGYFVAEEEKTSRTKKIPKALVLYPATDKHPAQVQAYNEDIIDGWWHTTLMSGAIPKQQKVEILERLSTLIAAVKRARETANEAHVPELEYGKPIFDYILEGTTPST